MILQDESLAVGAYSRGKSFTFFGIQNNSPEVIIDLMRVSVEVADVLMEHVQALSETGPSTSIDRMCVASSVHMRVGVVDMAVYLEASGIGRSRSVAAESYTFVVEQDQVGDLD